MPPDLGPDGLRDGVWLTFVGSTVFDSPATIAKALTQIREAGFDTVYPVIWNKGTTTFPSETMRRLTGVPVNPKFAGRDVLQEILDANRQLGLRLAIIPWFEYGLKVAFGRARNPQLPQVDDLTVSFPLAFEARKQGLLLKRKDGSDAWFDAASQHFFGFLNPADPRVTELLAGIAQEATSGYAVHGFQIDDHFSVHESFGFNDNVLALFEKHLVEKNLTRYSFASSTLQPDDRKIQDREWRTFRAGLVTRLAENLGARLPRGRPGFVYQMSPAGDIGFSFGAWLQNWRALVEDREVQEVVIQAYRDALGPFVQLISHSSVTVSRSRAVFQAGIFAGYKGNPRSTSLLVSQIRAARQRGMGVGVFFYDTLFTGEAERTAAIRKALLGP